MSDDTARRYSEAEIEAVLEVVDDRGEAHETVHDLAAIIRQLQRDLVEARAVTLDGCKVWHGIDEQEFSGCAACAWREYHRVNDRLARFEPLAQRAVRWNAVAESLTGSVDDPELPESIGDICDDLAELAQPAAATEDPR